MHLYTRTLFTWAVETTITNSSNFTVNGFAVRAGLLVNF